jgi:hypothetical protein
MQNESLFNRMLLWAEESRDWNTDLPNSRQVVQ